MWHQILRINNTWFIVFLGLSGLLKEKHSWKYVKTWKTKWKTNKSLYGLFKDTWWWSVALPLHREKAHYLPMDLCEQVLVVVLIISSNQWLSFPFLLLHLTEWIKQAVSGSRPSPALSLWQHTSVLLFQHFLWDRCPVSALETSVYYSREEEFQEKYYHNIHDRSFL